MVAGPCCAEFVASRAAIQRHPKQFYVGLRDWVIRTGLASKQAARALEYAWHLIFQDKPILKQDEQACLCALYDVAALPGTSWKVLLVLLAPMLLAAVFSIGRVLLELRRLQR